MIDLNNIINDAITNAVNQAVETHIRVREQALATRHTRQREVMRDLLRRIGLLEERAQVYGRRTEFLEACAAGEKGAAEDTGENIERIDRLRIKLEKRISLLEERVRTDNSESVEVIRSFGAVPNRVDELEKRLNTLRFQLEQRIEEVDRVSAPYAALEELGRRVDSLQRQVTAIDEANSKDAERFHEDVKAIVADVLNEGLAEAVADAFQNGSLTISVDKV